MKTEPIKVGIVVIALVWLVVFVTLNQEEPPKGICSNLSGFVCVDWGNRTMALTPYITTRKEWVLFGRDEVAEAGIKQEGDWRVIFTRHNEPIYENICPTSNKGILITGGFGEDEDGFFVDDGNLPCCFEVESTC